MSRLISEIADLFRREKLYLAFLICIIIFYGSVFYFSKGTAAEKAPLKLDNAQTIERILKEARSKPELIGELFAKRPVLLRSIQIFLFFFFLALSLGIWFWVSDLWNWMVQRKSFLPGANRPPPEISWGVQEVVKVIILFFTLGICLNLLLAFSNLISPARPNLTHFLLMHTLFIDMAVVSMMVLVIRAQGAGLRDLLGFDLRRIPFGEIWWGLRTYFVVLPVFLGLLALLVYLSARFSYEPPPHPLVEVLLEEGTLSPWVLFSSLLIACVVGPVVEEIFFRGFFYPAVRKHLGAGKTMLLTALLFAGVHGNIFSFAPILFLGLALCYLYEKRGNVLACISLHVIHNTVFIVYFFLAKSFLLGEGPFS